MDEVKLSRTDSHKIEIYLTGSNGNDEYFSLTQLANEAIPSDSEALHRMYVKEQSEIEELDNIRSWKFRMIGAVCMAAVVPLSYTVSSEVNTPSEKVKIGLISGAIVYGFVGEFMPRWERLGIKSRNKRHNKRLLLLNEHTTRQAMHQTDTES